MAKIADFFRAAGDTWRRFVAPKAGRAPLPGKTAGGGAGWRRWWRRGKTPAAASAARSLQTHLALFFVLVALVPLLITGWAAVHFSRDALDQASRQEILVSARKVKTEINDQIEATINLLRALRASADVTSMDADRERAFLMRVKAVGEDMGTAIGEDVHTFAVESFAVTDLSGQQIARSDANPLVRVADRDYYQAIKSGKKYFISAPLVSRATGNPSIVIAVPVERNGRLVGLLQATVNLTNLFFNSTSASLTKIGDTGYIMVVDGAGRVLAHPNPQLSRERRDLTALAPVRQVTAGQEGIASYTGEDGREMLAGYAPLPKTKWGIIATAPLAELTRGVNRIIYVIIAIMAAALLGAAAAGMLLARLLVRPIRRLAQHAAVLAQGNFAATLDLHTNNELDTLVTAFNRMTDHLRGLITKTQDVAAQVTHYATELRQDADQSTHMSAQVSQRLGELADGAAEQSASIAQMAAAVEETSTGIKHVVANVEDVSHLSEETLAATRQGNTAITQAVAQIKTIIQAVNSTKAAMDRLQQHAGEISQIVDIIRSLAGQTNLLALNAAIEAARAGESGRGFAVVADEVRKLAEQSGQAAQRIAGLIAETQQGAAAAGTAMSQGAAEVRKGETIISQAGQSFTQIYQAFGRIDTAIQNVVATMQQIASHSSEIMVTIGNVDGVAKQSAAHAQSMAAAFAAQHNVTTSVAASSAELARLAEELHRTVQTFKV